MATDRVAQEILTAMRDVIEAAINVTETRPRPRPVSPQTVDGEALLRLFHAVDGYHAALLLVADEVQS